MASYREVIQRVQSTYSKGVQSDDTRLSKRHIYAILKSIWNQLISEKAKKNQKISQWSYITLPCVKLIKAPVHECPCLPPAGCIIYRTEEQIPEILTNYDAHLIDSVSSIDGETIFSEISWSEKKYKNSSKYTATKPDFYIRNRYFYITQRKGATVISVTAMFVDPIEAAAFKSFCDTDCEDCQDCESPLDKEFPADADQLQKIIMMASAEAVQLFSQGREDASNDTRDTPSAETK